MWDWIRDHRRKSILETPFPQQWKKIFESNVTYYQRLNEVDQKNLRDLTQIFIAEKNWEGCGGLTLTDEIRVTIAAQACTLILEIPHTFYSNVKTILVYPSTIVIPERKPGFFEMTTTPQSGPTPVLGEAHLYGPIVLVWDSILQTARDPNSGHNVVYHEFAHKLDMLDGSANGTPPLETPEQYRQWIKICSEEFLKLRELTDCGEQTFLNSYGAVNEAEFFAVATEQFFEQSSDMKSKHAELYSVLSKFYRQDPS